MKSYIYVTASVLFMFSSPAQADILTVIIDPDSLPFDMGPNKFDNSPSRFDNSSSKFDNSVSKFDNSPSKFDNSSSKYENRKGGGRNVILDDGTILGYYVFSDGGMINFFNYNEVRVAYLPGGGHTQSVFSEDEWCGTLGKFNGELALGITEACAFAFLMAD